jgi:transposase
MEERMTSPATIEIQVDLPAGIRVCEYERIGEGHAFHVEWDWPLVCCCETCKREGPLNGVDKNKFLSIRDLDIWGQPSFFVYRDSMHRCPHCGHRQALIPPFKRRDVKYTYRFEEHVRVSLLTSTGAEVAKTMDISVETVDRIVKNRIQDAKGKKVDPQRQIERIGRDEISLRKGHKGYATILTDLTDPSRPEILAMAKGRDEAAGPSCLEVLTPQPRDAVPFHHTDMGAAFLSACAAGLKNSKSVIDRFHVAKKLGEVADALRKKTTGPTSAACPVSNGSGCAP